MNFYGLMVEVIVESGSMENNMAKELMLLLMAKRNTENGKMAKE